MSYVEGYVVKSIIYVEWYQSDGGCWCTSMFVSLLDLHWGQICHGT